MPENITQKLWNYCNIPRDDGMSHGNYVEQRNCRLSLKMTHQRNRDLTPSEIR